MKKVILVITYICCALFNVKGQQKLAFNLGVNSWQAFGDRASIRNPTINVNTNILYSLGEKLISFGYNFSYLRFKEQSSPYSIYFSDVNLKYAYLVDKNKRHILYHGLGFYIHHNLKNTEVYTLVDDPFYVPLRIHYPPNLNLDPSQYGLLKKMPIFIETGYKFYVLDNFYLGVNGRASVIRYETPVSDVIPNEIDSKLGFSYSIYYGLGYTFGRD